MNFFALLVVALIALLSSHASAREGNSRFHAAKCLAMKRKCGPSLQRQSGVCVAGKFARNQSRRCHVLACSWCSVRGKADVYPCSAKNVRNICKAVRAGRPVKPYRPSGRTPTTRPPATRPPTTRAPPRAAAPKRPAFRPSSASVPRSGCVYSGSDKVVIGLGSVAMGAGWTRTSRGGMSGIVYKKSESRGITSASSGGKMCFKIKLADAGDYIATAVSAAPHPTEHNDMWISSSKGFKLLRQGEFLNGSPGEFYKAYQNEGGNKMASYLSTVDHNAHAFVIPKVGSGEVFTVCMSGRSSKYEVFKLIVAKCSGAMCLTGRPGSLTYSATSSCS